MGKYYSLYNDVKLRKGGRKIAKLSEKQFGEKAKKFILDTCKDDSWTTDKMNKTNSTSKIISSLPRAIRTIYYNDKKGETIIKKDFKGIQPDWENYDITGGLRTVKGCPYIVMMVGGDWECPLCVMIYYDGKQFRCYIPEKGNAYRKDTKRLFGNCDASYDSKTETYTDEWKKNGTTYISDDKYAFDELVKEGILDKEKDKDKLRGLGRNIEFDTKKCIEDFTSRVEPISVKESYHKISSNDLKMIYESINEDIINEEDQRLTNKFNNGEIKDKIFKYFQTTFKPEIVLNIQIPINNIVNSDFYKYLMINIAGQLIEQYVAKFMIDMFKTEFHCQKENINTTKRGKVHDFLIEFNPKKNKELKQTFEIKSYNEKFGNITLTKNQRDKNNATNPIYVLCDYSLSENKIIITNIWLLLGSNLYDFIDPNTGLFKSKHISTNIDKMLIYRK